jgi:hypothetical protein
MMERIDRDDVGANITGAREAQTMMNAREDRSVLPPLMRKKLQPGLRQGARAQICAFRRIAERPPPAARSSWGGCDLVFATSGTTVPVTVPHTAASRA